MLDPVDALILDEALGLSVDAGVGVLVVDSPALAEAAREHFERVVGWSDSLLVERGFAVPVTTLDAEGLAGVGLVLGRLPKSLSALTELTQRVALVPGVRLALGGRIKHMTRSMNEVVATRFAEVSASLGRQKSRVLHAASPQPGPVEFPVSQRHPDLDLELAAYGATFGGSKVDVGTRLLISVLDRLPAGVPAVDLGCGNGTLACLLARQGRRVVAVDESLAACAATTESARLNGFAVTLVERAPASRNGSAHPSNRSARAGIAPGTVEVRRTDGLTGFGDGELELVVCNPPFHVGTAKDSGPAFEMIADAGRVLAPGGELWLVFNSHLPYLPHLRNRVGRTEIVARNPKFTVTRSLRPR